MKNILLAILFFSQCSCCIFGQERYSNIAGQKYYVKVMGEGSTTVIFENGMSDSLEIWGAIPDSISKFAKVFLYDRADIAKSDTSTTDRTIPNVIFELRSILKHENIKPPYVLVGHSLGGLITRYFTSKYPEEVIGLLLLDPCPESFWEQMSADELQQYIKGGTEWYNTKFGPKYRKEWYQFIPNLQYMKEVSISKDLPIILVSASEWKWYKYQSKILKGLENAKQIELEGHHHIFRDHPDLIIKYIRELLNKTRCVN